MQETLVIIHEKQKKWAEARKIIHGLLQEAGGSKSAHAAEEALQRSRQYLLLASVRHSIYEAHPNGENPREAAELKAAERFSQFAFNIKIPVPWGYG